MRERVFEDHEEQQIDIYDVKCKEWGFLLKKLFGSHLGTGDYGYLVVDHSAMLLRHFRSFYKYSGHGFESSHKLHRQLYSKATNHDASGPSQSLNQILTHWYATMLLSFWYSFYEARNCISPLRYNSFFPTGKRTFSYHGCGWKSMSHDLKSWTEEKKSWVFVLNDLFEQMFGTNFLTYCFDKDHGTKVDDSKKCEIF
ncbi:uncharacterized protein LOC113667843 [Pocillopora damicornis]|uniref:uncharacterized protein LOC113667843 n=1 Tax=Pocillopora damicornis TaxID=46731 RepID=UPI000F551EBF|nr:uncharacterized protein LOC113667843 [Pocillopora damicornis]